MSASDLINPISLKGQGKAIIFVHGFTGRRDETWSGFPSHVAGDEDLASWDVYTVGYRTTFWPDIRGLWRADPAIPTIAVQLGTQCDKLTFRDYRQLAFVAHSMGGLVIQRMLLDHPETLKRTSHVIMFGTPSNGLRKARFAQFYKQQIKNMRHGRGFIQELRRDWKKRFHGKSMPFQLAVAAGSRDQFVDRVACFADFPKEHCCVVEGDHLSIVRAASEMSEAVMLAKNILVQPESREKGKFLDVLSIEHQLAELESDFGDGSQESIKNAALAIERKGKPAHAICYLKNALSNEELIRSWQPMERSDLLGCLGGQFKRLWLASMEIEGDEARVENFFSMNTASDRFDIAFLCSREAFNLYSQGLSQALLFNHSPQIFYHAINLAFLALVHLRDAELMKNAAELALTHADLVLEDEQCPDWEIFWAMATKAEALLYLYRFDEACEMYRAAFDLSDELIPDNSDSTTIQAFFAAEELAKACREDPEAWPAQSVAMPDRLTAILSPWEAEDRQQLEIEVARD